MLYPDRVTLLPDLVIEIRGNNGLIDVARDYCWVSHIEVSLRQDLQD